MNIYHFYRQEFKDTCQKFFLILHGLNRRDELQRLVQWAEQKHLSHPLRLYQNRLADEQKRLLRYRAEYPGMTAFASTLCRFNRLISTPPRYLPKGSARVYRSGLLTNTTKSHSMLRIVS